MNQEQVSQLTPFSVRAYVDPGQWKVQWILGINLRERPKMVHGEDNSEGRYIEVLCDSSSDQDKAASILKHLYGLSARIYRGPTVLS
jgi:hypothetical protein